MEVVFIAIQRPSSALDPTMEGIFQFGPLNPIQKCLNPNTKGRWPSELSSCQGALHLGKTPKVRRCQPRSVTETEHSNNVMFGEKAFRGFGSVSAAVVKAPTQPARIHFPAVWNYCAQQRFHNIAKGVITVVTGLLSHRISRVKSINPPSDRPHKLFCPGLLLDLLSDLAAHYVPFHRMM
jgi:hypothetical protein